MTPLNDYFRRLTYVMARPEVEGEIANCPIYHDGHRTGKVLHVLLCQVAPKTSVFTMSQSEYIFFPMHHMTPAAVVPFLQPTYDLPGSLGPEQHQMLVSACMGHPGYDKELRQRLLDTMSLTEGAEPTKKPPAVRDLPPFYEFTKKMVAAQKHPVIDRYADLLSISAPEAVQHIADRCNFSAEDLRVGRQDPEKGHIRHEVTLRAFADYLGVTQDDLLTLAIAWWCVHPAVERLQDVTATEACRIVTLATIVPALLSRVPGQDLEHDRKIIERARQ